jgi:hypothetical protein
MSMSPEPSSRLVVRRIVVRPTPRRRHAIVRVIGEQIDHSSPRHAIVRIIGDWSDEPTVA